MGWQLWEGARSWVRGAKARLPHCAMDSPLLTFQLEVKGLPVFPLRILPLLGWSDGSLYSLLPSAVWSEYSRNAGFPTEGCQGVHKLYSWFAGVCPPARGAVEAEWLHMDQGYCNWMLTDLECCSITPLSLPHPTSVNRASELRQTYRQLIKIERHSSSAKII